MADGIDTLSPKNMEISANLGAQVGHFYGRFVFSYGCVVVGFGHLFAMFFPISAREELQEDAA